MAQRAQLDDTYHPLHEAYVCLLANCLDGAGEIRGHADESQDEECDEPREQRPGRVGYFHIATTDSLSGRLNAGWQYSKGLRRAGRQWMR